MKKAFTLIEILIVVILLGILAAVVVPQFVDQTDSAKTAAAASTEASLNSAWQQYVAAQMMPGKTPVAYPASKDAAITAMTTNKYIKEGPDTSQFTTTIAGDGTNAQTIVFTVAVGAEAAGS